MSNIQKSTLNPAEETEPKAPLTPEEFVLELRALRARIPQPDPASVPAAIRGRLAHVDPRFVLASINAVGTSTEIQACLGRTDEDLRAEIEVANRWNAAAEEGRTLVKELMAANVVHRQRVGLAALQTYQVCRQLARDGRHTTALSTHIAEMKRLNKFGRVRRKPPADGEPQLVKQAPK
jgi:hypothetical protein